MESMLMFKTMRGDLVVPKTEICGLLGPWWKVAESKSQLLLESADAPSFLLTDDFAAVAERLSALGKVVHAHDDDRVPAIFLADKVSSVEEWPHTGHYFVGVHGGMRRGRVCFGDMDEFVGQFEPGEFIRMHRADGKEREFFVRPRMVVAILDGARRAKHTYPRHPRATVYFRGRDNGIPMEESHDELLLRMAEAELFERLQRFTTKSDSAAVAIDPSAISRFFVPTDSMVGVVTVPYGTDSFACFDLERAPSNDQE